MVWLVRAATDRNPPSLGGGGCQDNGILAREGRRRAVLDKERLLRIVQREEELPYLRKRSSRSR